MLSFNPLKSSRTNKNSASYTHLFYLSVFLVSLYVLYAAITSHIPKGKLQLVEPNGGEEWSTGAEYLIQWRSLDVRAVDLYVVNVLNQKEDIATDIDARVGEYTWQIPQNLGLNEKEDLEYVMVSIQSTDHPDVKDISDRYFTIKEGAFESDETLIAINWMNRMVAFDVKKLGFGYIKPPENLYKDDGSFYENHETIYTLVVTLEIQNISDQIEEASMDMAWMDESGQLQAAKLTELDFEGYEPFAQPDNIYEDQKVYFIIPEGVSDVKLRVSKDPLIAYRIFMDENRVVQAERLMDKDLLGMDGPTNLDEENW